MFNRYLVGVHSGVPTAIGQTTTLRACRFRLALGPICVLVHQDVTSRVVRTELRAHLFDRRATDGAWQLAWPRLSTHALEFIEQAVEVARRLGKATADVVCLTRHLLDDRRACASVIEQLTHPARERRWVSDGVLVGDHLLDPPRL